MEEGKCRYKNMVTNSFCLTSMYPLILVPKDCRYNHRIGSSMMFRYLINELEKVLIKYVVETEKLITYISVFLMSVLIIR